MLRLGPQKGRGTHTTGGVAGWRGVGGGNLLRQLHAWEGALHRIRGPLYLRFSKPQNFLA